MPALALFDLDHTLLTGDSDVLWCEFLMTEGILDRAAFEPRNQAMEAGYRAGTVTTEAFCGFYVGTLAGRTLAGWEPLRQRFLRDIIAPRIPPAARAQVAHHQSAGDCVVMTTATNRVITELTAAHLGVEHLIATECEVDLHTWLAHRGQRLEDLQSVAYSDSLNDLALLSAATTAVAVDPDERLAAQAQARGWTVLRWR